MDPTAKVDIRKLQLLNDRIAQTIDALNQVRLSVHGLGLSHTPQFGVGQATGYPFAGVPYQTASMGYPYQVPFQAAYGQGMVPGLSHTTPWLQNQAYGQQVWGQTPYAQTAQLTNQIGAQGIGFGGGLGHTSPDVLAAQWGQVGIDPYIALRVMQSFPFAQMPISPVHQAY